MRTPYVTALAILVFIDGFVWLSSVLATLYYAFTRRALPQVGGIRLLSGPFEALGMDAMIVAGLVFVVVSGLKLLAAYWLWNARLDGAVLQLILLGFSAIFWYGFALPFGPIVGVLQIVALVLAWRSLS